MQSHKCIFEFKDKHLTVREGVEGYKVKEPSEQALFDPLNEIEEIYESELDITSLVIVDCPEFGGKTVYKCIYKENLMTKN